MIRVKIELVPVGINELGIEAETITLACRFPLDHPENQPMQVFTDNGKRYAEMSYNLQDTIYRRGSSDWDYLELIHHAIGELLEQRTTRSGGELYPGMLRLPEDRFQELIEKMAREIPAIRSITVFGDETPPDNLSKALALKPMIRWNGEELMKHYEGYQWLFLAVKLDNKCYRKPTLGELLEAQILTQYSTRDHPHVSDMRCLNGLFFFFMRPDGTIACFNQVATKRQGIDLPELHKSYTLAELQRAIKAGRRIYQRT